MDKNAFIHILNEATNKPHYRNVLIQTCLENPTYVSILLDNCSEIDNVNTNFSSRILELSCKDNLHIILPYIDKFCNLLLKIKYESIVRSFAKICELLMIQIFLKKDISFIKKIKEKHFDQIIEAGFMWMISNYRVAIHAYTMQTLYLLGTKYDWIHEELALILEKNIPKSSTGYVNRARKVIKAIRTKTQLKL